MLLEIVKEKLNSDERFHYKGKAVNSGIWETYTGEKFFQFKKNIGRKGYGHVRIILYFENEEGLDVVVEIEVDPGCGYEKHFEGFVETEKDFERLMVMLGIN